MPPRGRKRKSDQSTASVDDAPVATAAPPAGQMIATKTGSPEESPRKRQRTGVTAAQKQALIDNLQLEVTERARRLRAQYRLQAQGLRTRIELRVNRIPMALRKLKMGDLLLQHAANQHKPAAPKPAEGYAFTTRSAAPPLPEKDYHAARPVVSRGNMSPQARPFQLLSDQLAGGDKENQNHLGNPKKRPRAGQAAAAPHAAQPVQVLSPATSNSRVNPRERAAPTPAPAPSSPVKSFIARPMSPAKQSTSLLSSMVEKARATRAAATRKPTTSSMASSAAGGGGGTARSRAKAATASTASTATAAPGAASRPASRSAAAAATRNARRISGTSESSDASTSTVVRKVGRPAGTAAASTATRKATGGAASTTTRKTAAAGAKKRVTSATTKKATAAATKTAAAAAAATAAPAAATTTRSGRILRKRE